MDVDTRKNLFNDVFPLINQGKNADKMTEEQFVKIVKYANQVKDKNNRDKLVVDLVDSILACMDSKEQIDD